MEQILTAIIERLEEHKAELGLGYVDEEYGQVDALDDESRDLYAPTFPAVLVDLTSGQWSQDGRQMQHGSVTVNLNIYVDCYDDTHAYSTTIGKIKERMRLVRDITALFQGKMLVEEGGNMVRQSATASTGNHGIKLYQIAFTLPLYESFNEEGRTTVRQVSVVPRLIKEGSW